MQADLKMTDQTKIQRCAGDHSELTTLTESTDHPHRSKTGRLIRHQKTDENGMIVVSTDDKISQPANEKFRPVNGE